MTELANALMRAEAAEALLEELRRECEELRAENEDLHKQLSEKAPQPSGKGLVAMAQEDRDYYDMWEGDEWSPEELERLMRKAPPKLKRRGGPREKDWDRKLPPFVPPKTNGDHLEIAISKNPMDPDKRVLEARLVGGERANLIITRWDLERGGYSALRDAVYDLLGHIRDDPPSELVERVANEFAAVLRPEGFMR